MTYSTAAQSKAANIAVMGDEVGAIYSALWQEVGWIHRKWADYVALFGTKPERLELLNRAAPSFFRYVQDSIWEDVLLHLARLTDPPKSAGKRNLSLKRLSETVQEPSLRARVAELVAVAHEKTEFARDWRNRRLAHRDLDLALGTEAEPLAGASRLAVKEALRAVADVLNAAAAHYLDSTTMFELGFDGADAIGLLHVIRDGLRHAEDQEARVRFGCARTGDLGLDPI